MKNSFLGSTQMKRPERFVETADLSEYDFSGFKPPQLEFERKDARLNMHLPGPLLDALKERARQRGIPYQPLILEALERTLDNPLL